MTCTRTLVQMTKSNRYDHGANCLVDKATQQSIGLSLDVVLPPGKLKREGERWKWSPAMLKVKSQAFSLYLVGIKMSMREGRVAEMIST